jgi:microcystin degradation protein MlrC
MRVGIAALMHESNTFVTTPTTLTRFEEDLYLRGPQLAQQLATSHHEIGGFFEGLACSHDNLVCDAVPLAAFRATPSGVLQAGLLDHLVDQMIAEIKDSVSLDGLLLAVHGAAVAEDHLDADGYWLHRIREEIESRIPIIATVDPHANLSPAMVSACNAIVAYRTNPHLDQRERGIEAARLMTRTLAKQVRPTMAAEFPRLAINIERQCTSEAHFRPVVECADRQLVDPRVLSNSILLGFPYADVPEMGCATLVVTDDDHELARHLANDLASLLWERRESLRGQLISVEQAIAALSDRSLGRVCLLDMGDNVGGGSAADGTILLESLHRAKIGPAFVCIMDPDSVNRCRAAEIGQRLHLAIGGHTDRMHGNPYTMDVVLESLHRGRFSESEPRHGGIQQFDQGWTAVVKSIDATLTVMLTTRRMVPFSLEQLKHCNLAPERFRAIVAKGVHAPLAAYRDVCDTFLRVNTPGSTCADLDAMPFHHRRCPMFPWENPRRMSGS